MPTDTLSEFILYIMPGFIAILIYRSVYPVRKRENVELFVVSILIGLIVVNFIKWIDIKFFNNFLNSENSSIPDIKFTMALIVSGVIVGVLLILQVSVRNFLGNNIKRLNFLVTKPDTVWQIVNSKKNKDWALVFLNDNNIYLGWIKEYTFFPDSNDYEILLTKAKNVDDKLQTKYEVNGYGVYLRCSNIKRIEFLIGD